MVSVGLSRAVDLAGGVLEGQKAGLGVELRGVSGEGPQAHEALEVWRGGAGWGATAPAPTRPRSQSRPGRGGGGGGGEVGGERKRGGEAGVHEGQKAGLVFELRGVSGYGPQAHEALEVLRRGGGGMGGNGTSTGTPTIAKSTWQEVCVRVKRQGWVWS